MRSSLSNPASPSTLNFQGVTVSRILAERVARTTRSDQRAPTTEIDVVGVRRDDSIDIRQRHPTSVVDDVVPELQYVYRGTVMLNDHGRVVERIVVQEKVQRI